jgi:hypothetical protein
MTPKQLKSAITAAVEALRSDLLAEHRETLLDRMYSPSQPGWLVQASPTRPVGSSSLSAFR